MPILKSFQLSLAITVGRGLLFSRLSYSAISAPRAASCGLSSAMSVGDGLLLKRTVLNCRR